jgi:hypothetical protein
MLNPLQPERHADSRLLLLWHEGSSRTHTVKTPTTEELNMKRHQHSVLLASLLALSQLAACSSFGWKGFGGSSTPAPAPAPAPATTSSPAASTGSGSTSTDSAPASVTAGAAENGNASGSAPTGKN